MSEINNGYMSDEVFSSLTSMIEDLNRRIDNQVTTINNYNGLINRYSTSSTPKLYEPTKKDVDQDTDGKTFDEIVSIIRKLQKIATEQKNTITIQENEVRQLQKMHENNEIETPRVNNTSGPLSTKGVFDDEEDTTFSPTEDLNKDINKIF